MGLDSTHTHTHTLCTQKESLRLRLGDASQVMTNSWLPVTSESAHNQNVTEGMVKQNAGKWKLELANLTMPTPVVWDAIPPLIYPVTQISGMLTPKGIH